MVLSKFQGPGGIIPENGVYEATNSSDVILPSGAVATFDFQNESTLAGSTDHELDTYIFEHLVTVPTIVANGADPDVAVLAGTWPTVVVQEELGLTDRGEYLLHGVTQAYVDYSGGTIAVDSYLGALNESVALHPSAGIGARVKYIARTLEASPNGATGLDVEVDNTDSAATGTQEAIFNRAAGSYITDGFEAGDVVFVSGYAATAQNIAFVVKSVAATALTVYDPRDIVVLEASAAGQFVRKLTTKVWVEFSGVEGMGYET